MNIVFMGTPEFAVPTLQRLIESEHRIIAIVTQPDRPKGRGKQLVSPPIKMLAEQHRLPVLQPVRIKAPEIVQHVTELAPDAIVVVAYGQILPKSILTIPRLGCINVHASLLPKYRGAAPFQWAIIRGEQETGITTMIMDKGMDTGDILLQEHVHIRPDDTAQTLHDRLSHVGANLLLQTLQRLDAGDITPVPQNHAEATYAPLLKKQDGLIDWQEPARNIANTVRGMTPWPGAYTFFQGKMVKLLHVESENMSATPETPVEPGTLVALDRHHGMVVATGEGLLRIVEIQPQNKKPMPCSDFCRGYHVQVGDRLTAE